ncbi:MAG: hypothetical protein QM813_11970 [Verrucomicrobiota bacterium]
METNSSKSELRAVVAQPAVTQSNSKEVVALPLRKTHWLAPTLLLLSLGLLGGGLAVWKASATQKSQAAAANQPEPMETVTVAIAREQQHRRTTTAIGTVVALRSITLRNELPGTVREEKLARDRSSKRANCSSRWMSRWRRPN